MMTTLTEIATVQDDAALSALPAIFAYWTNLPACADLWQSGRRYQRSTDACHLGLVSGWLALVAVNS
jgi:hypothetical protein